MPAGLKNTYEDNDEKILFALSTTSNKGNHAINSKKVRVDTGHAANNKIPVSKLKPNN